MQIYLSYWFVFFNFVVIINHVWLQKTIKNKCQGIQMTGYPNENYFWHHTGLKGIDECMDPNVYTINVRFKKIIDLRYRFVICRRQNIRITTLDAYVTRMIIFFAEQYNNVCTTKLNKTHHSYRLYFNYNLNTRCCH